MAERHLVELRDRSAIATELIAERGYRTVTDPAELLALGFADYQCRTPALLIPLHGADGAPCGFVIKPDHPRVERRPDRDDRPIKYEYPAGQPAVLDVPLRCQPALLDPAVDLWITEGWKKGDALASVGTSAIALGGVWNWCHRDAAGISGQPLPDWDPILPTLDGRRVFIAFDSDAASNPHVGLAERRLANFLRNHGGWVTIVRLPSGPNGAKVGVDDFLVAHGVAALGELAAAAALAGSDDVRALRARIRQLEQQLSAQAALLRNAALTPTQKVVAIATVHEAGWRASTGGPAPYRVNASRLGEAAGVSSQTASTALKTLSAEGGLFEKRVTRTATEDGQWRSTIELTPRHQGGVVGLLKAAAACSPERPPDRASWGGKRSAAPNCPDHPQAGVVQRRIAACVECGQVLEERTVRLNGQDDSSDQRSSPAVAATSTRPGPRLNTQDDRSEGGCPPPPPSGVKGRHLDSPAAPKRCADCGQPPSRGRGELVDLGGVLLHSGYRSTCRLRSG